MVNEESFLTYTVTTIVYIFDWHLVDVVETGEEKEDAGEMVCPEMFVDLGLTVAGDTGYEEGDDEGDIAVDPDVVGEVVMILPVNHIH